MQLYKKTLILSIIFILFISCSVKQKIFLFEKSKFNSLFTPTILFKKKIKNKTKNFYSKLSPVLEDSIIYIANREGVVKAFEINNSKELWHIDLSINNSFFSSKTSALLSSGLTIYNNKIIIGTERGIVIALNKKNGQIFWKTQVNGEILSKPIVYNNLLIIYTNSGQLQSIDIKTGKIKWTVSLFMKLLSLRGESTPIISFETIIVCGDDGSINAISLSQGELIWKKYIFQLIKMNTINKFNDIDSSPIIDYGKLYVITCDNILLSLDIFSGEVLWKKNLSSINDMIISGENIYIIDLNDRVLSIRKTDGKTLWIQDKLINNCLSPPEMFNGYLVFGDKEGYLYWLNTINGNFVSINKIDNSAIKIRPIQFDDKLMVQTENGTVYLLKI
ncbi:outer membrane protein assembly factor BamB [Candidatus Providencia siddallii]|uniref:Outer membrane protein assembly factor BamB n=1 Tax=Candidatus Providencia siddallii TaxID=1715285 RepID=A0ABM9NPA8_9GAMM